MVRAAGAAYLRFMSQRLMETPSANLPDEAAWTAVASRDARFDGRFVYAVGSTGIYCRPSCPSRRPRRDRVTFFPDPGAAERAGYRACRRCRPRVSSSEQDPAAQAVERARAFLDAHPDEPVTLAALANEVGLSPWHLQRTFKRLTGLSPKEYAGARRLERLKEQLKKGDDVTTATYEVGYGSGSRVYEQSNARLGMTPGTYRRGGQGESIRYRITPSPLGLLLVGATGRGLCAVQFGDSAAELEAGLRREYPSAEIEAETEEGGDLALWTATLVRQLEGDSPRLALPLDVRATAFQWRVWKALQEIPRGETRSYGEVAAALGRPGAARAVARACASNRVALAIPCHRVVRGDGEAGGYRWGEERKRELLEREKAEI